MSACVFVFVCVCVYVHLASLILDHGASLHAVCMYMCVCLRVCLWLRECLCVCVCLYVSAKGGVFMHCWKASTVWECNDRQTKSSCPYDCPPSKLWIWESLHSVFLARVYQVPLKHSHLLPCNSVKSGKSDRGGYLRPKMDQFLHATRVWAP